MSFLFHLGLAQRTARTQAEDFAVGLQRAVSVAATAYVGLLFFRYPLPCATSFMRRPSGPSSPVLPPSLMPADLENDGDFNARAQCSDCLCSGRSRPSSNLRAQ